MRRLPFVLASLILLAGISVLSGHSAPADKAEELMKRKLVEAQKVLAGIALQDFDEISKHAEELLEISKQAQWKVLKTPAYENYSADFRASTEDLIKHAKKRNVDAAALAYVDMTLICVKCHKHVREKRMTLAD